MIVHPPELQATGDMVKLSVAIEYQGAGPRTPKRFWFEMPTAQEKFLSCRADTWAVNMLHVAMRRGETLHVRGALSEGLAENLEEYQRAISGWRRHGFKRIKLTADAYATVTASRPSGVGLPFSGGVDSFFTLWSHIPPQERVVSRQLTHGFFLRGDDIALSEEKTYRICIEQYGALLQSVGMTLFTLGSNIRDFYPEANWGWSAFPHLASIAMLYDKLFGRFYLSAGRTYWDFWSYERLALFDYLLSTETLEIVHDGLGFNRPAKTAAIASWKPVHDNLRICFARPDGVTNCCKCRKCLETMAILDVLGERQNFSTFPLPYTRRQLRYTLASIKSCPTIWDDRAFALAHGRRDIASDFSVLFALTALKGVWTKGTQALKRLV